jgi:hypothetical protein
VEIHVQFLSEFEKFVEYMFRKVGKDIIVYVGVGCPSFEELKKINVMIPEMHEKT